MDINEIMNKMKNDKDFSKKLSENPAKALEEVTGLDLPDEQVNQLVSGLKSKASEGVNRAKNDPDFMKNLKDNPVKAVESVTGLDLPDELVNGAVKNLKDKFLGGKK